MRSVTETRMQWVLWVSLASSVGLGAPVCALDVQWTGAGGNCLWSNQNNWAPQLAGPINAGALTHSVGSRTLSQTSRCE